MFTHLCLLVPPTMILLEAQQPLSITLDLLTTPPPHAMIFVERIVYLPPLCLT